MFGFGRNIQTLKALKTELLYRLSLNGLTKNVFCYNFEKFRQLTKSFNIIVVFYTHDLIIMFIPILVHALCSIQSNK